MFDIGFWEISLIGVIALLVIGPERLPAVARTVGLWVGKMQRFVSNVKDDVNRELETENLKKMLGDQESQIQELKGIMNNVQKEVGEGVQKAQDSLDTLDSEQNKTADKKA
ncbi:MAG: Sec-independent protein translocase protein TatB [Gammaproteobacteria bacterium]|nr:Sec-independent protein translocase protein TatB [Gammaproteobacteria bacterium]